MKILYTAPEGLVLCDTFQRDVALADASAESRMQQFCLSVSLPGNNCKNVQKQKVPFIVYF